MREILLVGTGGFLGSVARYAAGGLVYRIVRTPLLPWGTLAVNVLGCLAIGFCGGLAESRQLFSPDARLFLFIGIFGGFTTFSTFGYETFALARDGEMLLAGSNILLQVTFGLGAVWAGQVLSRVF
ncbi:MAG TPA: fluoride efflux transporter CrcB [bacterium]|jgi:CrcB protein